jgi:hypothetical protein
MNREQTAQELLHLAEEWNAAELHANLAFIEKLLDDDFIGIGPLGFLLTKQQWIQRQQSGELKYEALQLDEAQVRVYDQAAILICRQVQQATYRGNPTNAQLRTSLVFVNQQGQWKLAGLQYSSIGQPPSFGRS